MDSRTGDVLGTKLHNRIQGANQNCTWHNFNVVPTKGRNIAVTGNYQAGISVLDFTNPALVEEIAYADPAAITPTLVTGGDWSTYWHNGLLYTSDIRRGLVTWKLEGNEYTKRAHTYATSNPQTQMLSFEADNVAPSATIAAPLEGGQFRQNSQQLADYSCADVGLGVESCVGNVADGAAIDTSKIGSHTFTVTATDNAGNKTATSVQYVVNSTAVEASPEGPCPRRSHSAWAPRPRSARSRRASRGSTRRARPPTSSRARATRPSACPTRARERQAGQRLLHVGPAGAGAVLEVDVDRAGLQRGGHDHVQAGDQTARMRRCARGRTARR